MNVFEAVRENGITARQAAEHCGIKINRNGMAVCPFHKDKNPSMKIDRRYYCFGCGEKGDAIDFVAKFYGLGKKDAAVQIAAAFGISFDDNKGRKPPPRRKRKLSPEQRFERTEKKCFRVLSDYLCFLRKWQEQYAPHKAEEEWHPLFCEALEKKDYIEYLLDILLYAPLSERVELVTDYGEEVLRIQKVEVDRFARADLEWKLLMLDDDMKLEALPQTNNIKSIVTLEDKTDLERKGKQSEQGYLCVRFICFGNGNLGSLYDRSYGFFRRQIVLTVKEREPDRKDDPFLGEKLIAEAEGIFLWCLEGLHRLIDNGYQFTISKRAEDNLTKAMQDGNNIIVFMESEGYIRLEKGTHATSKQLYSAYNQWCDDNLEKPLGERSFSNYLRQNEKQYGLDYTHNIAVGAGKTARGFKGIHVKVRTEEGH